MILTGREIEVLTLVAEGHTSKRIGKELFLGEETIKWHKRNIYAKLKARNRTNAVAIGIRMGVIS